MGGAKANNKSQFNIFSPPKKLSAKKNSEREKVKKRRDRTTIREEKDDIPLRWRRLVTFFAWFSRIKRKVINDD